MRMKMTEAAARELTALVRSACAARAYVAGLDMKIIASTCAEQAEEAQRRLDNLTSSCGGIGDNSRGAQSGLIIEKYSFGGAPVCCFIIEDPKDRYLLHYMRTLADILLSGKKSEKASDPFSTREMLINQLTNSGRQSPEAVTLMKDFGYSRSCRRCAVLIEITGQCEGLGAIMDFPHSELEAAILKPASGLSGEDIYGFITSKSYMVYKDVSSVEDGALRQYLHNFAKGLIQIIEEFAGCECRAAAGSAYTDIFDLRSSYLEASFLLSNFDYLNSRGEQMLFIEDYVFEYLAEYAGLGYWRSRFDTISQNLKGRAHLLDTAVELSRNNMNAAETAERCGAHRNTMMQRFAKFREAANLDPAAKDRDRMLLRTFSLHINKRITLRVGIVIQPNSILHLGMQKLAEIIERESGGHMTMDIHTLSVSGNNAMLFESARSGALDMIVAATGVMNKYTDGLTALIDFPFLFGTNEEATHVLNSAFLREIETPLKNTGIKCLNIWSMGWRYITSRTPVLLPSDLSGQKIRIMSTESIYEYFRSMGAIPIHIDYGRVKEALHAGVIDCEENPYHNILGMKFYEEQRYITRLKYYLDTEGLYMCKRTWDALDAEHREMLRGTAKEVTEWIFAEQHYVINQRAKKALSCEHNMEILEVSPEQRLQWEEYAKPLYESYPHRSFMKKIMEARDEYRNGRA